VIELLALGALLLVAVVSWRSARLSESILDWIRRHQNHHDQGGH